ncbi:aminoacyl-tRNA hydrolase [Beijerinckia sp. L45]|uniref:aminoacyl-tRNA hydrolase n=1 Tax=Beijerinckia sp. L45 TaxID=1641855 RepID=UPI00131E86F5|nr:aminoacyl-tRNA hydrolase [Beijerinckia sp. L45]
MTHDRPPELKMWVAIRADLAMPPGKLAVQAGHAFVQVALNAMATHPARLLAYMEASQAKIAVSVRGLGPLRRVARECADQGIPHALITDAGRTVFGEPTETVCAFGPAYRDELGLFLKRLRLYGEVSS